MIQTTVCGYATSLNVSGSQLRPWWEPPSLHGVMLSYARLIDSYRLFIPLLPWGVSFSFLIFLKRARAGLENSSSERPPE